MIYDQELREVEVTMANAIDGDNSTKEITIRKGGRLVLVLDPNQTETLACELLTIALRARGHKVG